MCQITGTQQMKRAVPHLEIYFINLWTKEFKNSRTYLSKHCTLRLWTNMMNFKHHVQILSNFWPHRKTLQQSWQNFYNQYYYSYIADGNLRLKMRFLAQNNWQTKCNQALPDSYLSILSTQVQLNTALIPAFWDIWEVVIKTGNLCYMHWLHMRYHSVYW